MVLKTNCGGSLAAEARDELGLTDDEQERLLLVFKAVRSRARDPCVGSVRVTYIADEVPLDNTRIGHALSWLAELGYLERWSRTAPQNGRMYLLNREALLQQTLDDFMDADGEVR